jgi:hypothetical protein
MRQAPARKLLCGVLPLQDVSEGGADSAEPAPHRAAGRTCSASARRPATACAAGPPAPGWPDPDGEPLQVSLRRLRRTVQVLSAGCASGVGGGLLGRCRARRAYHRAGRRDSGRGDPRQCDAGKPYDAGSGPAVAVPREFSQGPGSLAAFSGGTAIGALELQRRPEVAGPAGAAGAAAGGAGGTGGPAGGPRHQACRRDGGRVRRWRSCAGLEVRVTTWCTIEVGAA